MKHIFVILMAFGLMILSVSCKKNIPANLSDVSLIPLPVSVVSTGSSYEVTDKTVVYIQEGEEGLQILGQFLAEAMSKRTGNDVKVNVSETISGKGISLVLNPDGDFQAEGYRLSITPKNVIVEAMDAGGVFYGIQTLLQVLQSIETPKEQSSEAWILASGTIEDNPEYAHRGSMLDVSRHFFGVEDVKRYIDLIAAIKLNVLHLHLADDQGWRIEIKSWPELTTIGGSTQVGGGDGGFYTQQQYKEIVKYARERFVTIIPEIDMPGHTNAALASYPELNCDNKARKLYTGTKVGFSTLCTRKEVTYKFVDDVIRELAALTDGPYIHIGGDESHVTEKDDYIYFINRVQDIVKKHNKVMIGWDEIAHANIQSDAIVQYWAKSDNALLGIKKGAKVIMSPAKRVYLDMQYDSNSRIGLNWSGYVEVDSAYTWDPATLVPGIGREQILGVESPLWTETVQTMDDIEYLVFPRLIGHAEIGWTPASLRNWDDYKLRLADFGIRMKEMGIDFYPSDRIPWRNTEE